jgi:thiol-disulfide isomerase/thioredoxin
MKQMIADSLGYVGLMALLLLGAACQSAAGVPERADIATISAEDAPGDNKPEPIETPAGDNTTDNNPGTSVTAGLFLPDMGLAPEIDNEVWLNSPPLRLADQRGKVVLVEFWTFGCINCKRVIPYMNEWHARYAGEDFVIISVHYPEFGYEENLDNVRAAVQEQEIEFAVAIDNDGLTWRAYRQRYWPTRYLIDKTGHLRYQHIGEGAYAETAAAIEQLIAESIP